MSNYYKKEWYSNKARVINQEGPVMHIDYGCSGESLLTCVNLFPGIQLMYQEMYTNDVFPSSNFDHDVMSINYCFKGRQESVFGDETVAYTPEGHLSVSGTKLLPESFSFPLKVYKGISIVLDASAIDNKTREITEQFGISYEALRNKYNVDKHWCMLTPADELVRTLESIWNKKDEPELYEIRLKVMTVLSDLISVEYADDKEAYHFSRETIRSVKKICNEMIRDCDLEKPIGYYIRRHNISAALFHKAFLQVYGSTPRKYVVRYKMERAAQEISKGKKICDVALDAGYSNPSKFSKAFKSVYGTLPKDYRKKDKI